VPPFPFQMVVADVDATFPHTYTVLYPETVTPLMEDTDEATVLLMVDPHWRVPALLNFNRNPVLVTPEVTGKLNPVPVPPALVAL